MKNKIKEMFSKIEVGIFNKFAKLALIKNIKLISFGQGKEFGKVTIKYFKRKIAS